MRIWVWWERGEMSRLFLENIVGIALLVTASRDGIYLGVIVGIHRRGCMITDQSKPQRGEFEDGKDRVKRRRSRERGQNPSVLSEAGKGISSNLSFPPPCTSTKIYPRHDATRAPQRHTENPNRDPHTSLLYHLHWCTQSPFSRQAFYSFTPSSFRAWETSKEGFIPAAPEYQFPRIQHFLRAQSCIRKWTGGR